MANGVMSHSPESTQAEASFVCYISHHLESKVVFEHVFEKRTEVVGNSSAKLWIQVMNCPDTDLYLAVKKFDADGKEVLFYHSTQQIEAPPTLGWLRASHRELDDEKSVPGRPYHKHTKRQWLRPCDVVPVDVELWPQGTVWDKGEKMSLVIQGSLFTNPENPTQAKGPVHGFGEVRIWFGGPYDSALFIPILE